ncbi:apolipoprotein N-acyltransferase [Pelagibacteraceae bacterium]|jgi:apolipoprotein N-acyltransferase|nr:apolipoprotein N-acyltransferase [Pelagibacteraceae bacterium]MDC1158329.1 apolipoprotein N-acyltransferase [Pelagibacteraceae bacterium]
MLAKFLSNRFLVLYVSPFVLGLLTVFTFQPFNLTVLNFIILPIFFCLTVYINKKSKNIFRKKPYRKNLFIFGCLFGFGFYLSGISWIVNSLTFDDNFKKLIPFAIIFIPLFLSLFSGFVILIIGPFLNYNFSSILIFAGSLSISDFLRAKLFTGFPWNLWAYSFSWLTEILQILNIIGLFAFNLLIITIFTIPAIFFFKTDIKKKIFIYVATVSIILGLYIFGSFEINKNENLTNQGNKRIYIKIISPNFKLKYNQDINQIKNKLKKLIRYSNPEKSTKTLFIWPEGIFSGYSYEDILVFKNLIEKNFSKKHHIIIGVNKLDKNTGEFYNSLLLVNNRLDIIQRYNKQKLVPFGEFLPFENILNKFGLKKITEGHGSFKKGNKKVNIKLDELNILPLICYEVIFTSLIQESDIDTNLIVNISEDGWFGDTIGPEQHYAKSIFRAIESGNFFLRAANKGISAIINNKGVVIKELNRNEAGSIEFEAPLIKSKKNKNDLIFFILLTTYLLIFKFNRYKKNEK